MLEYLQLKKSNLSEAEWDAFVDQSDNGTLFHKRAFLNYHPKDRFKDASIYVTKNGKILSVLTAAIVEREGKIVLASHPGASYGGFIYDSDLNFKDAHDLVDMLIEYGQALKVDRIQLTSPPIIYQTKYSNYFDFALYRNGFTYLKRDVSSIVQLDFDKDKLLETYRAEARTATKKAMKQGIEDC